MDRSSIVKLLVDKGQSVFDAHDSFVEFTKHAEANNLLNDLDNYPHAFVIGCVMDRQIKAERAWMIPYLISQKLGDFKFQSLLKLSQTKIFEYMTEPKPLHRFSQEMSKNFHLALRTIDQKYNGNAAEIWLGKPSSAEVVYRFLQFRGIGPKIATMAANILAREFKRPFADYYSIDISVDVQVRRVFTRLGLVNANDDVNAIIYQARALHPEFPGLLDFPAWEIGRLWCRPQEPKCHKCMMRDVCPTANEKILRSHRA